MSFLATSLKNCPSKPSFFAQRPRSKKTSLLKKNWICYSGQFKCSFDNPTPKLSKNSEKTSFIVKTQKPKSFKTFESSQQKNSQNSTPETSIAVLITLKKNCNRCFRSRILDFSKSQKYFKVTKLLKNYSKTCVGHVDCNFDNAVKTFRQESDNLSIRIRKKNDELVFVSRQFLPPNCSD